jgi:hypothetical protein
MGCYHADPVAIARLQDQSFALSKQHRDRIRQEEGIELPESGGIVVACLQCGKENTRNINRRSQRFCDKWCHRVYFNERFDRFIANPESIALPQNYDEFLLQEELPCLVDGCNWMGKKLAFHCNLVHGIPADKLKELAGFNRTTGLVTRDISQQLSDRAKAYLPALADKLRADGKLKTSGNPHHHPKRLESIEHSRKASLVMGNTMSGELRRCHGCGNLVPQAVIGRKKFCAAQCRKSFYASRKTLVRCCVCGIKFPGSPDQARRNARGLDVVCSGRCKGMRNAQRPARMAKGTLP